jgi:Flp pilus assembly protein TadG
VALARGERRGRTTGQALVEFAIILPVLLLVLGGIVQFATMFWAQNTLTQVVRDTGRFAATQMSCTNATPILNQGATNANLSSLLGNQQGTVYSGSAWPHFTVAWNEEPGNTVHTCPPPDNQSTWWVSVSAQHRVPLFIPFIGVLLPQCDATGCELQTSTRYRVEPAPGP